MRDTLITIAIPLGKPEIDGARERMVVINLRDIFPDNGHNRWLQTRSKENLPRVPWEWTPWPSGQETFNRPNKTFGVRKLSEAVFR